MLRLVRAGSGASRPLVIAYFVANHDALLAGLPAEACVLADVDNPGGRFTHAPGSGGVDTLEQAANFAHLYAGTFELEAIVLLGWSAGCEAVREQLRAGAAPDVVVCLDGVAGSVPPTEAQRAPWLPLVARARAGEACFVLTHSAMEYTEHLPPAQRFESTTHMAVVVTGTMGATPAATGDVDAVEGALYVLGYPSADIDAAAHIRQQTEVLPDVCARIVTPWLADLAPKTPLTGTSPPAGAVS